MSRQTHFLPRAAALALALATAGACTVDPPALADGDAGLPQKCSRYADLLVSYTPPDAEDGAGEGGERALGEPDDDGVPLAVDGVLTVGFVGAGGVEDAEDDDLTVHASGEQGAEITAYASANEGEFAFVGTVTPNETGLDLATARTRLGVYLRLVGTAESTTVDAVAATRDICGEVTAHRPTVPSSAPSGQSASRQR